MPYRAIAHYKTRMGTIEAPIVIGSWEEVRAASVEHFFKLYHDLCNEVGDRLETFLQVGHQPSQEIPLLLIRETLNDPSYPALCKDGHNIRIAMDGDDNITIQYTP